jgi:cytoskeletal protein CcmA (bactofilin family)
MAVRWVWQFQKNLREAYVWHRCTGEGRRLRALTCAWRTAVILMMGKPVTTARSPLGATLSGLARRTRADVASRGSSNAMQINVHLTPQTDLFAVRDTISRHPRISRSVLRRSLHLLSNMAAAIVDAAVIAVAAGASVSVYTQRFESGKQAMFVAFMIVGGVLSYRAWRTNRAERMMFFGRQKARRGGVRWLVPERTQPLRHWSPPNLVTKVRTFYKLHEPHVFRIPISVALIPRALSACLHALRERAIVYRHGFAAGMTAVGIWALRTIRVITRRKKQLLSVSPAHHRRGAQTPRAGVPWRLSQMVVNSARVSALGQRWTARVQQSRAMMAGPPGLATIGHDVRQDCGAAAFEAEDQASMDGRRLQAEHAGDQLQAPLLIRKPTGPPVPNDPVTVIGAGLTITGNLESKGDVQVEGEVQGDVHAQYIFIGERARITGALIAEEIVVRGNVQGSIHGNVIIIHSSGHIAADVVHKSLAIEQGAFFEGRAIRSEDPVSLLRTANGVRAAA